MIRVLLFIFLMLLVATALLWYAAQSLPSWYQQEQFREGQISQQLAEQIESQGLGNLLGGKFADVMRGQLVLNEAEFNAVFLASLRASAEGRDLLNVSDAINLKLFDGRIELGVIVNLDKLVQHKPALKTPVETVLAALPLLSQSRVFVAVNGQPIARDGNLALAADLRLQLGSIPISANLLERLGLAVFSELDASLPLNYMSINSVKAGDGEIVLGVYPRL